MVAHRARIFVSDEELAKRDDDHIPGKMGTTWNIRHRPAGTWLRKRRVFGILAAGVLVWLFIHNIPTDLGPRDIRYRYRDTIPKPFSNPSITDLPGSASVRASPSKDSTGPPPAREDEAQRSYDGPVKFYHLAPTLRALPYDLGFGSSHILFAASDLNCAASIIPMACEMARWNLNNVNFVIMGHDGMDIEELKKINGVDDKICKINWHDGRPDFAGISSDRRMAVSVAGALGHIFTYMHPQALIVADAGHEDSFFSESIQWKSKALSIPLIEVPKESPDSLSWLSRLSARALNAWHKASIDILIQVSPETSSSLVRLLRSLLFADYSGFIPPRLTIELPPKLDDATRGFLHFFQWPPINMRGPVGPSLLTIRRRIPDKRLDPDTATARFIESFYPTSVEGPNVLVLSPQAELSPVFFHYLKMQLLEYRYSEGLHYSQKLLGISLESPAVYLNGTESFKMPQAHEASASSSPATGHLSPFLWQAPNSNAALYFGDKWMELHSFLTQREAAVLHPRTKPHHQKRPKKISRKSPAWTEYLLDVMRARGYSMLYPGSRESSAQASTKPTLASDGLVVVHNDLYTPPEEYSRPQPPKEEFAVAKDEPMPEFLSVNADYLQTRVATGAPDLNPERQLVTKLAPILPPPPKGPEKAAGDATEDSIHFEIDEYDEWDMPSPVTRKTSTLPHLSALSILNADGELSSQRDLDNAAVEFASNYRQQAGGCTAHQSHAKVISDFSADDLFCLEDDDSTADAAATQVGDAAASLAGHVATPTKTNHSPQYTASTAPAHSPTASSPPVPIKEKEHPPARAEPSSKQGTAQENAGNKAEAAKETTETRSHPTPHAEAKSQHGDEVELRFPDDDPDEVHLRPDVKPGSRHAY